MNSRPGATGIAQEAALRPRDGRETEGNLAGAREEAPVPRLAFRQAWSAQPRLKTPLESGGWVSTMDAG